MSNKIKITFGDLFLKIRFSKLPKRTLDYSKILTIFCLLLLLMMLCACKGRKIRAELITLAKAIEGSREAGNAIAQKIEELNYSSPKENEKFVQEVDDLIGQINTLLEPIQALKFETVEVIELRDLYATAWSSLRDALGLISEILTTKDEKLAHSFSDRLSGKLSAYNQSITAFQQKYKAMLEKYGVTSEDIGPTPLKPAVTPSPFSSSPSP